MPVYPRAFHGRIRRLLGRGTEPSVSACSKVGGGPLNGLAAKSGRPSLATSTSATVFVSARIGRLDHLAVGLPDPSADHSPVIRLDRQTRRAAGYCSFLRPAGLHEREELSLVLEHVPQQVVSNPKVQRQLVRRVPVVLRPRGVIRNAIGLAAALVNAERVSPRDREMAARFQVSALNGSGKMCSMLAGSGPPRASMTPMHCVQLYV